MAWQSAALFAVALLASCNRNSDLVLSPLSCAEKAADGVRLIASTRDARFQGKVMESTAECRGGEPAVARRSQPWVDWANYFATGDESSKSWFFTRNFRGVGGALVDLEYQRMELIKFNLFDNSGTFEQYRRDRDGKEGAAQKSWPQMRLPESDPHFSAVGGAGEQLCRGELIRIRTLDGICNDTDQPADGLHGTPCSRATWNSNRRSRISRSTRPPTSATGTTNRHAGRISLLTPDPQVISRRLFTRAQSDPAACNDGYGKPGFSKDATATTRRRRSSTCWRRSGSSS